MTTKIQSGMSVEDVPEVVDSKTLKGREIAHVVCLVLGGRWERSSVWKRIVSLQSFMSQTSSMSVTNCYPRYNVWVGFGSLDPKTRCHDESRLILLVDYLPICGVNLGRRKIGTNKRVASEVMPQKGLSWKWLRLCCDAAQESESAPARAEYGGAVAQNETQTLRAVAGKGV